MLTENSVPAGFQRPAFGKKTAVTNRQRARFIKISGRWVVSSMKDEMKETEGYTSCESVVVSRK